MFLHAVMLAGVGAAVLPVVLHLLSRARYRDIDWGAMMFLPSSSARLKNRSRLAQWLLLLLRIAAIAALAIALARPVSRNFAGAAGGRGLSVAIVIDGSPSMLHPEQNTTRFELARRAALAILADLRSGDEAALIELGSPYSTDTPPTTDLQRIASRLASLEPAAASADLADGIRRARSLLADRAGNGREIYLLADRQRSTWQSLDRMPAEPGSRVVAVPIGSTENRNVAIESVGLLDPPAVAGQPVRVRIRVHNWADTPRGDLGLSLASPGVPPERATLNLAAGASEHFDRSITLPRAGPAVLAATISPSGLPGDDAVSLAIDVIDPIRVLTLTADPPGALRQIPSPAFTGACDYLAVALDPFAPGPFAPGPTAPGPRKKPSAFKPEFASVSTGGDIGQPRVLVLADTVPPDEAAARSLEQFVFAGGGLLLSPGPHVTPSDWNRLLWKDGQGLAPSPIEAVTAGSPTGLVGVQTGHPVFAFFGTAAALPAVEVVRWPKFLPRGDVLASLKSGDPFLIERPFGRGRVIAMAGPVDATWSNLPFTRLYLPLMQSLVRRLASATAVDRNLPVNAPIEATITGPKSNTAEVVRPDGRSDRVPLSIAGGVGKLVYTAADVPGRYFVRTPGQPDLPYVVRGPLGESDLSLQDDDALRALARSGGVDFSGPDARPVVGQSRKASEWSIPLILITIIVLTIELSVATRISSPAGES